MGQSPASNAVSLRTFNRNFEGRSGTVSAKVYLVSPEVAAVSAITGVLTDPNEFGKTPEISMPKEFLINDNLIIPPVPEAEAKDIEIVRGPNIKPFPVNKELDDTVGGNVLIKVEDNITTDHIMPSNAKLLPFRSNIPHLAEYCLTPCDPEFPKRAKENGGGFIVGGSNYGQGSSREHAALVPLYLGIKGVLAKSFARIHMANLINSGILPLTFKNAKDYDKIDEGDELILKNAREQIKNGSELIILNKTKKKEFEIKIALSGRQVEIILAGGLLNYTRKQNQFNL
jgi:aconitate hydratase